MGKNTTPRGILSFAQLHATKYNDRAKRDEYSLDILFPEGTDLAEIEQGIEEAFKTKHKVKSIPKAFKSPLKNGDDKYDMAEPDKQSIYEAYRGKKYLTLRSETAFRLVDLADGTPRLVEGASEIRNTFYSGAIIQVPIDIFGYDNNSKGVSIWPAKEPMVIRREVGERMSAESTDSKDVLADILGEDYDPSMFEQASNEVVKDSEGNTVDMSAILDD